MDLDKGNNEKKEKKKEKKRKRKKGSDRAFSIAAKILRM